jgi:hypothetical protein
LDGSVCEARRKSRGSQHGLTIPRLRLYFVIVPHSRDKLMRNTDSIQTSLSTAVYGGGVPAYSSPALAGETVTV